MSVTATIGQRECALDRAERVRRADDGLHVPAVQAVTGEALPVVGEHATRRPARHHVPHAILVQKIASIATSLQRLHVGIACPATHSDPPPSEPSCARLLCSAPVKWPAAAHNKRHRYMCEGATVRSTFARDRRSQRRARRLPDRRRHRRRWRSGCREALAAWRGRSTDLAAAGRRTAARPRRISRRRDQMIVSPRCACEYCS